MKTIRFSVLVLVLATLTAGAQDVYGPIKAAIKAGNADELSKYFHTNLDVNIEGNQNAYNKQQAVFAVSEFFKAHPPTDFNIVHKGASQGGLQFAIGKYATKQGTYTVMIRVKESGKTLLIHDISFVKEK